MIDDVEVNILKSSLVFWNHLSDAQRKILVDDARVFRHAAGSQLHFGENDCIGVLIVKEGTLRTSMLSDSGKDVTLYRLNKWDLCVLSAWFPMPKNTKPRELYDHEVFMVFPRGFEPPAHSLGNCCSILLSYGNKLFTLTILL